jgi:hypothetical protein
MPHAELPREPLTTEKIAQDVKDRVDHNDLKGAYDVLNLEAHQLLKTTEDPQKRQDIWMLISTKLENNGTLPKVAAEWLLENGAQIGGNNGNVEKRELDGIANNAQDMVWKGLATESSKNFKDASQLGSSDQNDAERNSLDARERKFYADRMMMPTPEEHANQTIKRLENNLERGDKNAFLRFLSEVSQRFPLETAEERQKSWGLVAEQLREKDLMGGFAQEFNKIYKDSLDGNGNKNGILELDEVTKMQNAKNPMMASVAKYVAENLYEFHPIDFRPKPTDK